MISTTPLELVGSITRDGPDTQDYASFPHFLQAMGASAHISYAYVVAV